MYDIHIMFEKKLNILITGSNGQLGAYLVDYFRRRSFLKKSKIGKVFGIDIEDLDIRNRQAVSNFFNKDTSNPPIDIDYVIHCAAATNTAAIEKDPTQYYAANCLGPKNIANACAHNGIKMIFISTDYVLSERSPITENSVQEFPMNQYGLQKLIAEQFVKEAYADKPTDYMILRSSWMFGNSDNSFVEKFLKNVFTTYAKDKENKVDEKSKVQVSVADDAYGRPTPVWFIADTIKSLMLNSLHGTMDLQYPCHQVSRYEWATMIWESFIESDNDSNSMPYRIVDMLKDSIEIVPKHSKDIGIQMHHPGRVGDDPIYRNALIDNIDSCFAKDTNYYVKKNWLKYVNLANEIIVNKA